MVQQALLKIRQPKEIALFGHTLGGTLADLALRRSFALGSEQVARGAVPTRVLPFVDGTTVERTLKHFSGSSVVAALGCADKLVVLDSNARPEALILSGDLVRQLFW